MRTWSDETRVRAARWLRARLVEAWDDDRGDVPGWVMVTLMSALLVAAIIGLAQEQLESILSRALETVLP